MRINVKFNGIPILYKTLNKRKVLSNLPVSFSTKPL
ncbi:MAG: hypothetical protein A4E62_02527 [Syntrophorhabdus sp. PtaU1.Bin002]|nr:MAG: hypothetical protein A4E62_02527 [Syntrophorhabdus sp. PtaU1.Bin002]